VKLITELWYVLTRREKIDGAILLCGMALGALFEAITIGLIVPFIAILRDPDLVFKVSATRRLLSFFDIHDSQQIVVAVGSGLIGIFIVKSCYLLLLYRWQFRYIFAIHARLGSELLAGYLSAPYTFHLQRNSAELVKTTTESIQRFSAGFLLALLTVLGEVLVVLAVAILLMLLEPLATFGAMLVLGLPTALIYVMMRNRLATSGHIGEQSFALMLQWIEQAIGGIKETLVTGRAPFFIERHGFHIRRVADSMRTVTFLSGIPRLVIDTLAVSAMVASVLVVLARGQDLQAILPVLTMFALAAMRLMPSTNRIANGLAQIRFHYAAAEAIHKELVATRAYRAQPIPPGVEAARLSPQPFQRSLVLDRVSYRFPSMPMAAVDDVSLEIPRGHWVAFVGPTGAGKTTLVDMILGLFVPTSGRILVDGRDVQEDVAGWQRNIGLVPQSVYLMDDTIRRNVAFGLPDQDIDDERVWQVLRAAQIDRLVHSLPGELDATVGERGDRLSGGERQRLGIARALYRDPQVLILDEGTANLDNETEAGIGRTLAALRNEKTIIVVAHRLALVRNCDCVYLLEQGRLRNSGRYSELVSTDPAFRDFAGVITEPS
jgi:ATP-binding cassette subfamily C protein